MKGEIKQPEIRGFPVTPIQEQSFEKREAFLPIPFFNSDQVGNLPIVQFLFLHFFIQAPKKICRDPSLKILLPTIDSEQREEVSFEPFLFKGEEIKDIQSLVTPFLPLIIVNRPDADGFPFLSPLMILARSDAAEEDSMGDLMEISHPVLFVLIERIEDVKSLRLSFSHLIAVKKKESFSVEILPFESSKERPGEIPLFKTASLLSGMREERPQDCLTIEIFGFL
jgi:hypothetical protein